MKWNDDIKYNVFNIDSKNSGQYKTMHEDQQGIDKGKSKIRSRKWALALLVLISLFALTGCQNLDVIGNGSKTAFEKLTKKIPDLVTEDTEYDAWAITAPDNSARFLWSKNAAENTGYDAMLKFDAKPFQDAGLDTGKLPDGMIEDGIITVGTEFENAKKLTIDATPLISYEQIVKNERDKIGYHATLDYFGINLGNGNMFEWAKNMETNDKDMVYVLNPEIFINAGVNPEKVKGWAYAKIVTMDENGKKKEVYKLLKPFDLP